MLPPMRFLPAPRPISQMSDSTEVSSTGVDCVRTSSTRANAEMIKDTGELEVWVSPLLCQRDCIDSESLPTGMLMSSAGHSSMPTACTA